MSDKSNRSTSYVRSMLKYCQDILDIRTTSGETYEAFIGDKGYQYSVSFCIEQIGELAKKLRKEGFAEKYPNVEWDDMAGMRNRIAHGYDTVDLDMVYGIITEDIPQLYRACHHMLINETRDVAEKMALAEAMKNQDCSQGTPKEKEHD